jgi:hypothetical protein
MGNNLGSLTRHKLGVLAIASLFAQPTLTNFSALGAAPLVLQWSTTDYVAGYRAQLQIATDAAFTAIAQNIIFFIDGASWALGDEAIALATPNGTYWARIRVVRDNEIGATTVTGFDTLGNALNFTADASAWSTSFTDTILVSVAALNTNNGFNKHANAGVSGSPALNYTCAAQGAFMPARATLAQQSNNAQLEYTISAVGSGFFAVGYDDDTTSFTAFGAPGATNNAGIAVVFNNASDIQVQWNTGAGQVVLITGLGGGNAANKFAVGDTYTSILNESAHTLALHRTRSGTTIQIGATATGLPAIGAYWNYVAGKNGETLVMNYGASAFAKALSGDAFYG